KLEKARALGAWKTLNYKSTPQWGAAARKLTDGFGVDHVIEVGGADTLEQSLRAARPGGSIYVIGVLSGATPQVDLRLVLMQGIRLQGVFVGTREMFEDLASAFEAHGTKPVVDRVFAFEEARAAFDHMASGAHFGKVVVRGA